MTRLVVVVTLLAATRTTWAQSVPSESEGPIFPEFQEEGSLGIPWYASGGNLTLPIAVTGDNQGVQSSSLQVRKVFNSHFLASGESSPESVYVSEGKNRSIARLSTYGLAFRVELGSSTRDLNQEISDCNGIRNIHPDYECDYAPVGDSANVAFGWLFSLGVRVGYLSIDKVQAPYIGSETILQQLRPWGSMFGSLSVKYTNDGAGSTNLPDGEQVATRYYGGALERAAFGFRIGYDAGGGAEVSYARRQWSEGATRTSRDDYAAELVIFGAARKQMIGATISRPMGTGLLMSNGQTPNAFQVSIWFSPGI